MRTAVQFLPGSVLYAVAHIVFCTEGDTDQTLGSVTISTARVMPSGDSIAASRPVCRVHDHRLFRCAGSLFRYPDILSGIGFRQTHNVRTTANDASRSLTPHSESSAFTRTMVSYRDTADVAARGKPCGGLCLFTQCHGVFEVKHQGISRVDE